jgi:hypothetical protein
MLADEELTNPVSEDNVKMGRCSKKTDRAALLSSINPVVKYKVKSYHTQ